MEFLKSVFGGRALTYSEFEALLRDSKDIKLANIASGQYVDKDKFDRAQTRANDLQLKLAKQEDEIAELQKTDAQELSQKLQSLQEKYDSETGSLRQKLSEQAINSRIDMALLAAKAKNTRAVRALLDEGKISLDGENILGIEDQLASIRKENPFLFGEELKNPPPPVAGDTADPIDDISKWRAEAGLPIIKN